jgi:hypothetical protein
MTVTISPYNHTLRRFADGSNVAEDTYRLMLCTSATFSATDFNLANVTKFEVLDGNGYTTKGPALTGVTIATVNTNGCRFDADDVTLPATGGSIIARYGILYNDTDANDPVLFFIDFGETKTATANTDFVVAWSATGIVNWALV